MRQTTVLIAQLSSAAGVRAPLAHVADEVFLHLSSELEQQGVTRKVVADMFGLALRGYQRRVQRLSESTSKRGTTLWSAVLETIESEAPVPRARILERFQYDDPLAVAAVLKDLTSGGLLSRTGSGEQTIYSVAHEKERRALAREGSLETASLLVWLTICRAPDSSIKDISASLSLSPERTEAALARLEAEGTIRREGHEWIAERLIVPVGAEHGWEVAVYDHFQTVCVALAAKLKQGLSRSGDTTGGQTLSFDIDDDHPERDAVLGLLNQMRTETNTLWERVELHNQAHPQTGRKRVRFYMGQVELDQEEEQ